MAPRSSQAPEAEVEYEDPAEENEITGPSNLGFVRREVEVEPVDLPKEVNDGMVMIRMSRTIEEFTYGNPHQHHRLEAGRIYRVPTHIASYLYQIGALVNSA